MSIITLPSKNNFDPYNDVNVIKRFWKYVKIPKNKENCWEWIGTKSHKYGQFWNGSKRVQAHRFSYELLNDSIPKGMVIDHLCRNEGCVNPEHLEVVTHTENVKRGLAGFVTGLRNRAKKMCPYGHPYDEENTYVDKTNRRCCRACWKKYHQTAQRRKREKLALWRN